jgi:hypothetical protein
MNKLTFLYKEENDVLALWTFFVSHDMNHPVDCGRSIFWRNPQRRYEASSY